jgi:hypothetical protein
VIRPYREKQDVETPKSAPAQERWLLLLHQIPAKPDYLRVKVWRRMQRIGAVAIKNAAWVLPPSDAAMEDFQWLIREIEADGGEALLCEARFLAGLTAEQSAGLALATSHSEPPTLRSQAATVQGGAAEGTLRGRVWVTRRDMHVDRIASAWLVRRWIDPEARFKFVAPEGYVPEPGEIRFDMYDAEYTHVGDSCTFEVLASTFIPNDPAIGVLAEIVHDIDLKESRFGRPEAAGVQLLIEGLVAAHPEDETRLERGTLLFDDLYAAFQARRERSALP